MKIRGFPNNFGSGYWRMIHPGKYLSKLGHTVVVESGNDKLTYKDELVGWDIIVPQGVVDLEALKTLLEIRNEYGTKIMIDFDDMLKVGEDNPHHQQHEVLDAVEILQSFTRFVDGVTTTNDFLAERLKEFNKNVYVVDNYMDLDYWQLPLKKNTTDKIRICYVGSVTHILDIELVAPALKKILTKYKDKVELIMVGDLRWREYFEGFNNVECQLGVPFESYASRLNGLGMDIGIAPLRDTEFNHCKSTIKWMENTIAGGVTVASPTKYNLVINHGENGFIANTTDEWVNYLSQLIEDATLREKMHSRAYKDVVQNYSLGSHAYEWENIYKSVLNK